MRVAVISDIHGNAVALDAVLADLREDGLEEVVCLGDAIQGGPQPAEVVARLRGLLCPVVMGNADAWLLSGVETADEGQSPERRQRMEEIRTWSLAQLSEDDRAFIAGFKPTIELPLDAGRVLLCFHGSPQSFDDIILPETPEADFRRLLGAYTPRLLAGGHTHLQQIRRLDDTFFFNPGSVGFAYSHHQPEGQFRADAWAEYAVLAAESGRVALVFRRVPFDVSMLVEAYRASGRPHAEEAVAQYQVDSS